MTEFVSHVESLLAYPALFKPHQYIENGQPKGAPKFNATFLLLPTWPELPTLRNLIIAEADAKFPGAIQRNADGSVTPSSLLKLPLQSGEDFYQRGTEKQRKAREVFRPYIMFRAAAGMDKAPALGYKQNGVVTDLPLDESRFQYEDMYFFGGAHVVFKVNVVPYKEGAGITAYLNTVTSLGAGTKNPAFQTGGNAPASAVHGGHVGEVTGYNPLAGAPQLVPAPAAIVPPPPAAGPAPQRWF